jgi:ABC-type branched-subunit amino acid transport system substrate-binding protein
MKSRSTGFAAMQWYLTATVLAVLLTSCGWLRPATDPKGDKVYKDEDVGEITGGKVYDPETGTYREVREVGGKVDTVRWTDLPEDKYPPIKTDTPMTGGGAGSGSGGGGTKPGKDDPKPSSGGGGGSGEVKNVTLLLPFMANTSATSVPENSLWAVNFYGGARLAYDELEKLGVKLNVNVLDSDATTAKVESLLKSSSLGDPDLIIGPYKRDQVELAEDFAKKNKVPIVVPYTAQLGIAEGNPYYIQVNPSLKSHCEAMTRHIRQSHQPENVVLVALDKAEEKARFKYFQDENTLIGKGKAAKFQELLVPEGATNFHTINVSKYLKPGSTTVFVVPSWSNQTFIYSLLRKLRELQGSTNDDLILYGMSMWLDFEQIDFEYFEKLNLHVSSAAYVDPADERVVQFKKKFFESYGTVPNDEAYLGYDVMRYFGHLLWKQSGKLTQSLDANDSDVLTGRFTFGKVVANPAAHKEDLDYLDYWENTHVHILRFRDFRLQPAE